jgi:ribosomal protein S25
MSDISKYEAQKKKLEGLCEEHDFTFRLRKETWPITLTISPLQGMAEQMTMLEEADGSDYISPNASLTWIFDDGDVTSRVEGGTFTMPKTLESKFVNIFKKMVAFWQMYFFRYLVQNGFVTRGKHMPVIDENDAPEDEDEQAEPEDLEDPDNVTAFPAGEEEKEVSEDLIKAATQLVRHENKATMSLLQRRLNIGYAEAGRLMQKLYDEGVVGPYQGNRPREVLPYDVPEEA